MGVFNGKYMSWLDVWFYFIVSGLAAMLVWRTYDVVVSVRLGRVKSPSTNDYVYKSADRRRYWNLVKFGILQIFAWSIVLLIALDHNFGWLHSG